MATSIHTLLNKLAGQTSSSYEVQDQSSMKMNAERRIHRRCEIEESSILVERFEANTIGKGRPLGHLVNLSAGGLCIRTAENNLKIGTQIRIRMVLPSYAGIMPFVAQDGTCRGTNEWAGWMTIVRVTKVNGATEIGGRMVDMREIDRGMLGLSLSAQPLAA